MHSRLRLYVESLFDNVEKTIEVVELREEILQNVVDKYQDLLREGKSEEEAYHIAISGIGDINQVLESMGIRHKTIQIEEEKESSTQTNKDTQNEKKSAFLLAGAIMLYIVSMIPVIIADELFESDIIETIAVCIMMLIIATATGIIIFYYKTKPKQQETDSCEKEDDEDEWHGKSEERKQQYKTLKSAMWSVIVAVYFIISFLSGAWYITWVIFLLGVAVENILKAYLELKE